MMALNEVLGKIRKYAINPGVNKSLVIARIIYREQIDTFAGTFQPPDV
jgi:hypothetical protein